jgi:hypothetical protein
VLDDPSVAGDVGLLDEDLAAGVEVGDEAPPDVDGMEEVALEMDDAAGAGIDPDAAFEAGEGFGLKVRRGPVGVGLEVEDDEWRGRRGWGRGLRGGLGGELGLAGGVAPEHGVGHDVEEVNAQPFVFHLAVDVAGEVGGRGDEGVEALALRGIFIGGKGAAVALDDSGDAAVRGLDLVAELVAFFVDDVEAVAEEGAGVLDDEDLVPGAVDGPSARGDGERRGRNVLRGCGEGREGGGGEGDGAGAKERREQRGRVMGLSALVGCRWAGEARAAVSRR